MKCKDTDDKQKPAGFVRLSSARTTKIEKGIITGTFMQKRLPYVRGMTHSFQKGLVFWKSQRPSSLSNRHPLRYFGESRYKYRFANQSQYYRKADFEDIDRYQKVSKRNHKQVRQARSAVKYPDFGNPVKRESRCSHSTDHVRDSDLDISDDDETLSDDDSCSTSTATTARESQSHDAPIDPSSVSPRLRQVSQDAFNIDRAYCLQIKNRYRLTDENTKIFEPVHSTTGRRDSFNHRLFTQSMTHLQLQSDTCVFSAKQCSMLQPSSRIGKSRSFQARDMFIGPVWDLSDLCFQDFLK